MTDIRWATQHDMSYIDKLQRANAEDLAFYPLTTLATQADEGRVLMALDNDTPCGYLWFGALRSGYPVTIYQACIDYEVRRRMHGWALVGELTALGKASGASAIRLKCHSSALSNEFWQAIGFRCTNVTQGGVKRSRDINHWWSDIAQTLLVLPSVEPSTKLTDLTSYNRARRAGVPMPNPWSRTHYGKVL